MNFIYQLKNRASRAIVPFISLFLIVYFVFHLLEGQRGLNVYLRLNDQLLVAQEELDRYAGEKHALEQRVALLHPQHLDVDLAEENIRSSLGLIHTDEKVILLPRHKGEGDKVPSVILIPK